MPKTIALDFDGVLHSYVSGWTGPEPSDPPVPGAQSFVRELLNRGWQVVIVTARVGDQWEDREECQRLVEAWLDFHGFPPSLHVTANKPAALVYVDDRAYRFTGDFGATLNFVSNAKKREPWTKTEKDREA